MRAFCKEWLAALWLLLSLATTAHADFDHRHAKWTALLQRHVVDIGNGHASRVDYRGFLTEAPALDAYLGELSAVSAADYARFSLDEKKAFLINAYNAFTIQLILSRYPELASIKDIGNLLQSPWKKRFFTLLGETRSLDWIEHDMLRKEGVFDDARIHFAVNCASIGCPKLQRQAFLATGLNQQLDQAMTMFLQDRSRNYYDAASDTVYLSKIFDWFDGDFERQYGSLEVFVARHAEPLGVPVSLQGRGSAAIAFTDYDWSLNDTGSPRAQPDHSSGAR